eukprot:366226-Chlamydomonas_euryale.AAC.3
MSALVQLLILDTEGQEMCFPRITRPLITCRSQVATFYLELRMRAAAIGAAEATGPRSSARRSAMRRTN